MLSLFSDLGEAAIGLPFPLFIEFAVDGAIKGKRLGAILLGLLGLAAMIVGVGRRFYAQVFKVLGRKVVSKLSTKKSSRQKI